MPTLFVTKGNDQGRRFEISENTITIGRGVTNHIQLRDSEISRHHAVIVVSEDGVRLTDNGSVNKTYVNEIQKDECFLNSGDRITLGQTTLIFINQASDSSSYSTDLIEFSPAQDSGSCSTGTITLAEQDRDQDRNKDAESSSISSNIVNHLWGQLPSLPEIKKNPQIASILEMMYHTSLVTGQTLEIGTLLSAVLSLIAEIYKIDRGCVLLHDPDTFQLVPNALFPVSRGKIAESPYFFNVDPEKIERSAELRKAFSGTETLLTDGQETLRSFICAPMTGRYGFVGIIYIDVLNHSDLIHDYCGLMDVIAHQAALAVEDTRYYKQMIRSERLAVVGKTVSTLSHHIKNILQGINGGSYLIRTGLDNHDEKLIRNGWNIVEKNQNRISKLIHDMLTFSKEREPTYELGDIVETLNDVIELMQIRAKESDVELQFEVKATIPKFFFDSEQLYHAIINIVTNGIDAAKPSPDQGSGVDPKMDTGIINAKERAAMERLQQGRLNVYVDLDPVRSVVIVGVDDSGSGIPETDRKYLFRAFYSQKKGRGTGLGLSAAHKVVQEHGGTIRITDSPLGGARFKIELPLKLENPSR